MFRLALVFAFAVVSLAGCSADDPLNPSFPLKVAEARDEVCEMEASPKPLERPVVILAGLLDPGFMPWRLGNRLRDVVSNGDQVLGLHFFWHGDFESARAHVIAEVDRAFPSDDPEWTTEVDVIGSSMGGLVARYAALPPRGLNEGDRDDDAEQRLVAAQSGAQLDAQRAAVGRRNPPAKPVRKLRIARLFTLSAPHQGAKMAWVPVYDPRIQDMRKGSPFIAGLNAALPDARYEMFCYVRLHDATVGEENAAPPGRIAWWVQNIPLTSSHVSVYRDPRIFADIARRLRGEQPYTTEPPAPLPE